MGGFPPNGVVAIGLEIANHALNRDSSSAVGDAVEGSLSE